MAKKLTFCCILVVLIMLAILAAPVAAGNEDGNITAEALALLLAGFVAPYLAQVLKKLFGGLEARPALWLAFAVAVVLALLALLLTGELGWSTPPLDPIGLINWFFERALAVFGLATLVYKNLISAK